MPGLLSIRCRLLLHSSIRVCKSLQFPCLLYCHQQETSDTLTSYLQCNHRSRKLIPYLHELNYNFSITPQTGTKFMQKMSLFTVYSKNVPNFKENSNSILKIYVPLPHFKVVYNRSLIRCFLVLCILEYEYSLHFYTLSK